FMAYGSSIVFDARIRAYNKVILYIIFISIFLAFLPYVMNFAKIENLDTATIENYASHKATALASKQGTASAIDISNYPYPFKVFTFLFRPFFIDMPTVLGILTSIENLIFMVFFLKVLYEKVLSGFRNSSITVRTLLFFFIIGSLTFPIMLGNLGI